MNSPQVLSFLTRHSMLAAFLAISVATTRLSATPYASGVTNNAGTVSFRLNESADSVKIIFNNGASTNDLGAQTIGVHSFNMGTNSSFKIVVFKNSAAGYFQVTTNQLSDDANNFVKFANQRGVGVNKNPASRYFGRVYVAVAAAGASAGRSVTEGIYILNPDMTDAIGQGDAGLKAGIPFSAPGGAIEDNSPHRLTVGPDDNLYIGDWSLETGGLYVTDPNVSANSGTNVLFNPAAQPYGPFPLTTASGRIHGSISANYIEGSLATGNLTVYVIDEDLQTDKDASATEINSIWRWDIGAGPLPFSGTPVKICSPMISFASQLADFTRGPDGKYYVTDRRAEPAGTAGVFVRSTDGATELWNSLAASRAFLGNPGATDILGESQAIDVSFDGKYMAVLRRDNNLISVVPLANGIPDLANRLAIATSPTTGVGRDISFDAAGNIYVVSSGQGFLRVYSPGGKTTTTTGSDGTFTVTNEVPQVVVSVTATTAVAAEGGQNGVFTVTRTGDTTIDTTVYFTLGGTAGNGVDYTTLATNVTILAGQSSAQVVVAPIDDSIAEPLETVILTIIANGNYQRQAPFAATVSIVDNDIPAISVTAVDALTYERVTRDVLQYRFTRLGLTNNAVTFNLAFSGTAVNGVDYGITNGLTAVPTTFTIPAGVITADLVISPINDNLVEGSETVIVTVAPPGTGYTVGTPAAATGTIIDDDLPAETVLFSDNFDTDTSANWNVKFGANFGGPDYFAAFNFDYYNNNLDPLNPDFIPPSPRTADAAVTRGLKMTVNKDYDGNFLDAAAGINFYPKNQSFSNNFILRFSMFMDVGGGSTTEHAVFGINHSGNFTNRFSVSTDTNGTTKGGDGIWFSINNDNGTAANTFSARYTPIQGNPPVLITNRTALGTLFPNPPYDVAAGLPGILRAGELTNFTWVDVEVSQLGRAITLKMNNTVVFTFNNPSIYTNGNIMLGYVDPFNSTGTPDTFVVYDDVRVISTLPTVNVISNSFGAEPGTGVTNGSFTVFRNGGTNTALTVNYAITGSAINGTDYQTLPTSVVIPIGAFSTNITYVPLSDNLVETNETVILTLTANANYDITGANPLAATNIIRDTLPVMPMINTFTLTSTNTTFAITGGISDRTNQFVLESSSVVTGSWAADLNAIVQFQSNGSFLIISTNLTTSNRFYRIKR